MGPLMRGPVQRGLEGLACLQPAGSHQFGQELPFSGCRDGHLRAKGGKQQRHKQWRMVHCAFPDLSLAESAAGQTLQSRRRSTSLLRMLLAIQWW